EGAGRGVVFVVAPAYDAHGLSSFLEQKRQGEHGTLVFALGPLRRTFLREKLGAGFRWWGGWNAGRAEWSAEAAEGNEERVRARVVTGLKELEHLEHLEHLEELEEFAVVFSRVVLLWG